MTLASSALQTSGDAPVLTVTAQVNVNLLWDLTLSPTGSGKKHRAVKKKHKSCKTPTLLLPNLAQAGHTEVFEGHKPFCPQHRNGVHQQHSLKRMVFWTGFSTTCDTRSGRGGRSCLEELGKRLAVPLTQS